MSKSKAPEYPEFNTQTPELRKAIATAIAAIPATQVSKYETKSGDDEVIPSPHPPEASTSI